MKRGICLACLCVWASFAPLGFRSFCRHSVACRFRVYLQPRLTPWANVALPLPGITFPPHPPSESSWLLQPCRLLPARHPKVFGKGCAFRKRRWGKPFFRKASPSTDDESRASTKISNHTRKKSKSLFPLHLPVAFAIFLPCTLDLDLSANPMCQRRTSCRLKSSMARPSRQKSSAR